MHIAHVYLNIAVGIVTGEKFKTKDLVPLVNGGTSFTASGQVEVTKYAPGLR